MGISHVHNRYTYYGNILSKYSGRYGGVKFFIFYGAKIYVSLITRFKSRRLDF